ncbi:MAG: SPOR domain-containing protein [Pseudomonadota bacterium]
MAVRDDLQDTVIDEDDEYEYYDDEDDEDGGLSGFVVLLLGVVMLGAFASVVWFAYQQGLRKGDGETPYVAADPEPVKIATVDGIETEPDRAVFDTLENASAAPVETLSKSAEEPLDRSSNDPIAMIAAAETVGETTSDGGGVSITEDAVADRIAALEAAEVAAEVEDAVSADTVEAADVAAKSSAVVAEAKKAVGDEPAKVVAPVKSVTEPKLVAESARVLEVPKPVAVSALSGTHVVQVGAFRSENEAVSFWGSMGSKVGSFMDGKARDIQRADLGDKGVYYRLRIGPFASSTGAKEYCAGLKERGQDCIAKAK